MIWQCVPLRPSHRGKHEVAIPVGVHVCVSMQRHGGGWLCVLGRAKGWSHLGKSWPCHLEAMGIMACSTQLLVL